MAYGIVFLFILSIQVAREKRPRAENILLIDSQQKKLGLESYHDQGGPSHEETPLPHNY
jgi:hypothetical protein